jgi:peroxiredoxin
MTRTATRTSFSILCLLLLLSTLPAFAGERLPPPDLPELTAKPYGSTTYALTVRDLEGNEVKLSDFKGRTIFLHYWATYCQTCVSELPSLQRLRDSLRDRDDIVFLLVSKDDDAGQVKEFLRKRGLDLPVYMRMEAAKEFPAGGIPVTFVVDRNGTIRIRHSAPATWDSSSAQEYLRAVADAGRR